MEDRMSDSLSICWAEYNRFQSFSNARQLNRRSWGLDEALAELLIKIEASSPSELTSWLTNLAAGRTRRLGKPVELSLALRAWLKNLATNRSKKYRSYLDLREPETKGYIQDPLAAIMIAADVQIVQSNTTSVEWNVLWHVAAGGSYQGLAYEHSIPESTLKSMALRCRRRLAILFGCAA